MRLVARAYIVAQAPARRTTASARSGRKEPFHGCGRRQETIPDAIEATVNYIHDNGEKLFTYTGGAGSLDVRTGGTPDPRRVTIRNARPPGDRFALDREGFRFVPHDTGVADFFDEDEVRRVYYPEMEALVRAESGAVRVVVFDHTLRTADDELRESRKIREVVRRVHNDYTEWSGPQRVRDLLPDEAEELLRAPLRHRPGVAADPPSGRDHPLAICDARSIATEDFVVTERRYPNRIGQTYAITYNPGHRWYWLPRMRRDEALVFKVYDSAGTAARAGPRTPLSTIRPRRPPPARARASRSARWRSSERSLRYRAIAVVDHERLALGLELADRGHVSLMDRRRRPTRAVRARS